jgi:SSS family solute:Na+ symporter
MSCVVALYLLFSPIGLVGGLSDLFWPLILTLVALNVLLWWRYTMNNAETATNPESS